MLVGYHPPGGGERNPTLTRDIYIYRVKHITRGTKFYTYKRDIYITLKRDIYILQNYISPVSV